LEARHIHGTDGCRAVSDVIARIGDKWTVYVVGTLSDGPMRFNEIKRAVGGISQRMLTLTLRGLERDGLLTRTVTPSIPPRVDYELTDLGRTLISILAPVGKWALDNRPTVEAARLAYDSKAEGPEEKASRLELKRRTPAAWRAGSV
jgi:DNA-binding HxlR family transcriptional regulator